MRFWSGTNAMESIKIMGSKKFNKLLILPSHSVSVCVFYAKCGQCLRQRERTHCHLTWPIRQLAKLLMTRKSKSITNNNNNNKNQHHPTHVKVAEKLCQPVCVARSVAVAVDVSVSVHICLVFCVSLLLLLFLYFKQLTRIRIWHFFTFFK